MEKFLPDFWLWFSVISKSSYSNFKFYTALALFLLSRTISAMTRSYLSPPPIGLAIGILFMLHVNDVMTTFMI